MQIHHFKIDELERGARPGRYHHLRRFLTIYRGKGEGDRKLFAGHIETIVQRPRAEFSVRFHVGTAGSETPFDGHLLIFGTGFYWGIENGRKLADRITREKAHKYEGRDLALRFHDGRLWVTAWVHPDHWSRGEFARWRSASIRLNLLDRILGERRYTYENLEWALIAIEMPEGTYPVRATLQQVSYGRPKSKRSIKSLAVDIEAPKGIPDRFDPSGGWKGDRVYGFGVELKERRRDWAFDAENAIKARIYKTRSERGFREAQEVEPG